MIYSEHEYYAMGCMAIGLLCLIRSDVQKQADMPFSVFKILGYILFWGGFVMRTVEAFT